MRKALLLFVLFAACVAASYPQAHAEFAVQGNQTPPARELPVAGTLPAALSDTVLPDTAATAPDNAQQAVPGTVPTSDLPAACPGNQAQPDTAQTPLARGVLAVNPVNQAHPGSALPDTARLAAFGVIQGDTSTQIQLVTIPAYRSSQLIRIAASSAVPVPDTEQTQPSASLPDTAATVADAACQHVLGSMQAPPPGTLPDTAVTAPDKAQQAVPGTVPASDLPAAGPGNQASPDTVRTKPYKIVPDTVKLRYYLRDTVWKCTLGIFDFIRDVHPDMYAHTSAEVMERNINSLKYVFPDSMTAYQAYSYIAPVVALVGDGHTYVSTPWDIYLAHNPYWLPAHPYIDKKDLKLKLANAPFEYSEIVGINGRRNRDMVDEMMSYQGVETVQGKVKRINDFMPLYFALVDSSSVFRVEYAGKDGVLHTAELEGVRIKEHQRRIGVRNDDLDYIVPEEGGEHGFSFTRGNQSTVLLSMPGFDREKAPPLIDSMFAYIKSEPKVKNLIIDLRDNGGGSFSVMSRLLKYLSPVEFPCYEDFSNLNVVDSGKILRPKSVSQPLPKRERFRGDLYVLIDNGSYSSSIIFAHFVKQGRFGTLVGEQTGGSVFTNAVISDPIKFPCGLELKCSVFTVGIPDLDHYRRTMEPVYPDVEVPSAGAFDKALEIIASGGVKRSRKGK